MQSGIQCRTKVPFFLTPLLFLATTLFGQPAPDDATIRRYCIGCHNAKLNIGGLSLESHPLPENLGSWEKVVRRLRARQMPPAGLPRPDEASYKSLVSSLETKLDNAAALKPNPGRTDTFRRLNRTEYHNAIRDLLTLDIDVSSLLPADEASHGFDNLTVGDLSPTLLERYLAAARKISRLAIGIAPKSPGGDTITLRPDLTQEDRFEGLPLGTRGGTAMRHVFPVDGLYDFQLRLARRDQRARPPPPPHSHEVRWSCR